MNKSFGQLIHHKIIDSHCHTKLVNAPIENRASILLKHLLQSGPMVLAVYDAFIKLCDPQLAERIQREIEEEKLKNGLAISEYYNETNKVISEAHAALQTADDMHSIASTDESSGNNLELKANNNYLPPLSKQIIYNGMLVMIIINIFLAMSLS